MEGRSSFVPALLVVDMQEDFCAPDGSLGIQGGRELAPVINELLALPFSLKIATKDFHPADHVSFNTNHPPPNNKAFESTIMISNPFDPIQSKELNLWPVHCVQGTPGADIIREVDTSKLDFIVEKGRDRRVEMFSIFADMFGNKSDAASYDVAELLKSREVTDVFVLGLAGDYCVKCTAIDSKKEGFRTFVVEEGTRSVDEGEKGWGVAKTEFQKSGVLVVSINGQEVNRVKSLKYA